MALSWLTNRQPRPAPSFGGSFIGFNETFDIFDVTMTSAAVTRAAALAEARTAGAVPRAARLQKILAGDVIGHMQSGASLQAATPLRAATRASRLRVCSLRESGCIVENLTPTPPSVLEPPFTAQTY